MTDRYSNVFRSLDFYQQCAQCGLEPTLVEKLSQMHLAFLVKENCEILSLFVRVSVDPEDALGTLVVTAQVGNGSEDEAFEMSLRSALAVHQDADIPWNYLFRVERPSEVPAP